MSTSPTVPMFAPDGKVRDVPYEQMHDALSAGGKLGVYMKDPKGTQRIVPSDQVQDAVKAGGTMVPYNLDASHQSDGYWKSLGSDLAGMVKSLPSSVEGIFAPGGVARKIVAPVMEHDEQLKSQREGLPYRTAAATAQAAGVNVPGMEKAAAEGDAAGVMGHATAAAVPYVVGPLAADALKAARPGLQDAMRTTAERAYQSAMKPSTTMGPQKIAAAVNTGLEHEIPVSEAGATKLGELISDYQQKVKDVISYNPAAKVNKFAVASRLGDAADKFSRQVNPEADLEQISKSGQEFLENQPGEIPAKQAQELKQGTYQQLKGKAYGEVKTASIEAQKSLARGIKEELEAQFPELKNLNAQEGQFYNLEKPLQKALDRINNKDIIGLGTPVAGAAVGEAFHSGPAALIGGILKHVIEDPAVKSRLAIMINKGARGNMDSVATSAKIAAYSAALGRAASSGGADARSSQTQP